MVARTPPEATRLLVVRNPTDPGVGGPACQPHAFRPRVLISAVRAAGPQCGNGCPVVLGFYGGMHAPGTAESSNILGGTGELDKEGDRYWALFATPSRKRSR
jgi:hypothetical protein